MILDIKRNIQWYTVTINTIVYNNTKNVTETHDIYAFNIVKTIIGESIIFICCICSFIIRKICVFYDNDLNEKREKEFDDLNKFYSKMIKYICSELILIPVKVCHCI